MDEMETGLKFRNSIVVQFDIFSSKTVKIRCVNRGPRYNYQISVAYTDSIISLSLVLSLSSESR